MTHTGCLKKTQVSIERLITLVWKLLYVKVRIVLKSSDSQLSYEHKKKVISCRNCCENCNWSVSIKICFCYCNVSVTFSLLSCFLAYLGQFESKSHIQGHPWKAENIAFIWHQAWWGFRLYCWRYGLFKMCPNLFDRPCTTKILGWYVLCWHCRDILLSSG